MTRDDAVTIVAMVVHGWPGPAWETDRLEAYVDAILPLDAVICTRALARARNALKYRPAVSEIREFYQIERRLSQEDEARLVLPDKPDKPDRGMQSFVKRWVVARFLVSPPDMRPFPEQHRGGGGQLPVGASEWMPDDVYIEEAKKVTDDQVRAALAVVADRAV